MDREDALRARFEQSHGGAIRTALAVGGLAPQSDALTWKAWQGYRHGRVLYTLAEWVDWAVCEAQTRHAQGRIS